MNGRVSRGSLNLNFNLIWESKEENQRTQKKTRLPGGENKRAEEGGFSLTLRYPRLPLCQTGLEKVSTACNIDTFNEIPRLEFRDSCGKLNPVWLQASHQ
jgi:hypothetical protein